jgi:hypothetical protein
LQRHYMIGDRATRYGVTLSGDNIPRTALRLYGVIERKTPDGVAQLAQTLPRTQASSRTWHKPLQKLRQAFVHGRKAVRKLRQAFVHGRKVVRELRQAFVHGRKAVRKLRQAFVHGCKVVRKLRQAFVHGRKAVRELRQAFVHERKTKQKFKRLCAHGASPALINKPSKKE